MRSLLLHNKLREHRWLIVAGIVALVVILGASLLVRAAGGTPFGGEISEVDFNTCCNGFLITVDDIVSGEEVTMVFIKGVSKDFAEHQIMSAGANSIGLYRDFFICLDQSAECESLVTDGIDGEVVLIGTSRE